MNGESIPYQLRQNKAVDRYAFIELLSRINKFQDISQYEYVGFGGHSLEDFKYIHAQFGILEMTSLESEESVYTRQMFNLPHSCIKCTLTTSHDFIADFERNKPTIIWLDYTKPSELRSQIEEFQAILGNLYPLDVVKITLNANAASYEQFRESAEVTGQARLNKLIEQLGEGDLFPLGSIDINMMIAKKFPMALSLIVKYAAEQAMRGRANLRFQALTSFSYSDGQTMLTITGVILEDALVAEFLEKTGIERWSLANTTWSKPKAIDIPNLTIKERLFIDALLPHSTSADIQAALGFSFHRNTDTSIEMISNYSSFYRQSPYFSRVVF
jgi:hypothetical protein